MQIEVSLPVYKALTEMLRHEDDSYDALLRNILEIDSPQEPEPPRKKNALLDAIEHSLGPDLANYRRAVSGPGFVSRSLYLPDGTSLRARYKGRQYIAKIDGEKWVDHLGNEQSSPSAAAHEITGTNVNGLRFWEAQFPDHSAWVRLDRLK